MFYVYKITNKVNGKVYIGKTGDVHERWMTHLNISEHPEWNSYSLIHKAIAKYGKENFIIETIEEFDLESDALNREIFWITFYKTHTLKYGNDFGYNLTAGGDGSSGFKHSEESKQLMSEQRMGDKNAFFGKHHSEKTIMQIKETLKGQMDGENNPFYGQHHSEEFKQMMSQQMMGKLIGDKNPMYGKSHTEAVKLAISKSREEKFDFYSESNKGSKNPMAKLTEEKVSVIKKLIEQGKSDVEISKLFSVSRRLINGIRIGTHWKHV